MPLAMIDWETVKEDFWCDGSLRDIYIAPASIADWRAIYPILCDHKSAEFTIDGVRQPLPAKVDEAFAFREVGSPALRVAVGRALVVFHFFSSEEIECDINPREITSQVDLDALLGLVRRLGDATNKSVSITSENSRDEAFIVYAPDGSKFQHVPISAAHDIRNHIRSLSSSSTNS